MYGYVYKTTDIETGAIYIGQHTNQYVRKYQKIDPKYFGSGKIIQNILHKYGPSRLKCEILIWCDSKESLDEHEIFYIEKFKSEAMSCYNIAKGGNSGFNILYLSPTERKAIKQKELATKRNKSATEKAELAERIRNTLLNKSPEEKARLAKQHSETWFKKPLVERQLREDHRAKTRAAWTEDQRAANSEACRKAKERPVIVTNDIETLEFPSALECSRALGWADCMAGMYIRKYEGIIKNKKSKYRGWKIYYRDSKN